MSLQQSKCIIYFRYCRHCFMALVKFYTSGISSLKLANRMLLKSFILQLFNNEQKNFSALTYVFTTDHGLLDLNVKYLNHKTPTDIITFNLSNTPEEIVGEVYISVERVKDNSKLYEVSFRNELLRVIFHGALHLCGYNDKKKSEITIMKQKEDQYLFLFEEHLKNRST